MTSSFCIATGRRPHAMPVYGTSTMRCPDHARGTWGLRALNMTPYRGSTMCPHNKSRPQRIHAGREGPFAQSRALVNSSPPTKSPRAISPVRGCHPLDAYVQAWDDRPPHGPLRAQCRLVGEVHFGCVRSRAGPVPDLSSFALQLAHGDAPAPLRPPTTAYGTVLHVLPATATPSFP